jgi:2-dehydropantoate 2-reductase
LKFAIFGAGAVGGYFGGCLAKAGHQVSFIARGRHLESLRRDGLRVNSIDGDFIISKVKATDTTVDIGPVDVVLVTVKTWQLANAIRSMGPLIGSDTVLVPLLNGVEAHKELSQAFGENHVIIGLAKIIARLEEPGHIHHLGATPYIAMGELNNQRTPRVESLQDALSVPGITAEIPTDIHAALWSKFLFVASWGGVGAVTRAPLGVLRSLPQTRHMITEAMDEIYHIALSFGIKMPENIVESSMAFVDSLPAEGTTSLQSDIIAGRPSEIDAWSGAAERLGRQIGIATPINSFISRSLVPLEKKALGEINF